VAKIAIEQSAQFSFSFFLFLAGLTFVLSYIETDFAYFKLEAPFYQNFPMVHGFYSLSVY